MRRAQLEHAIRTACQIIKAPAVIVVGSQAILGTSSALPDGWRDRLVKIQNANTAAPSGHPEYTGWCLEKHDLCVAKLCALREKDQNFVAALLAADLLTGEVLGDRLSLLPAEFSGPAERARRWLRTAPRSFP